MKKLVIFLMMISVFANSYAQLNVQIKLGDRTVCSNEKLLFLDSVVSGVAATHEWISHVATFTSTTTSITEATFSGSGIVVLKTTDAIDVFYDTVNIVVNPAPTVQLRTQSYCENTSLINAEQELLISALNLGVGSKSWRCIECNGNDFENDVMVNRGARYFPYTYFSFDNYIFKNPLRDTLDLEFRYTNEFGCSDLDTTYLILYKKPRIFFNQGRELCYNEGKVSLNTLYDVNLTGGSWAVIDSSGYRPSAELGGFLGDSINTFSSLELVGDSSTPNAFYIRYTDISSGCETYNDTTLIIHPHPDIQFSRLNPTNVFCNSDAPIDLEASPAGGKWTTSVEGTLVDGDKVDPSGTKEDGSPINLYYSFTSPVTGCSAVDSIRFFIDFEPVLSIPDDTFFCFSNGSAISEQFYTVTAQYTDDLLWFGTNIYGNRNKIDISSSDVSNGKITFRSFVDGEKFRIGINAQGRGACRDMSASFEVEAQIDSRCKLSTNNFTLSKTKIYPNPSKGWITIDSPNTTEVNILDCLGRRIEAIRRDNMFYLPSCGLYFIGISTADSQSVLWHKVQVY